MIIQEFIKIQFKNTKELNFWNKKFNSNYSLSDEPYIHWTKLITHSRYRWTKILVECDKCHIKYYKSIKRICNEKCLCRKCIQSGELGYWWHKKMPEQVCKNRSKMFSGTGNPFYGKTHTDEIKEKIRNANKGNKNHLNHKHSTKTKQKISKIVKQQFLTGSRTVKHGR